MPNDLPQISFTNNRLLDLAFVLNTLSSKSPIHCFRKEIPTELEMLARDYTRFAAKNSLFSPRDGMLKFHFLSASLVSDRGSVFPDVNKKYQKLVVPFKNLIENGKTLYSSGRKISDLGNFVSLWNECCFSLENVQKIARLKFRLKEYSIFLLLSLSGRFGMPCMVHDKYVFVNAQKGEEEFLIKAVFHELLHQLLLGHRFSTEGKFFTGHFLWQPRRAIMEEIALACLEMELSTDPEEQKKKRDRVLHLDKHLPFLTPFKPLFSKVLQDWESYISSQNVNLQNFIDECTRKYLKPLKFLFLVRHLNRRKLL